MSPFLNLSKQWQADRLPLIVNAQPQGPYRLCGYCSGGLVAFEVARMLIAAGFGKIVEIVVMVDFPTLVFAHRFVQTIFSMLDRVRPVSGPFVERAKHVDVA